jgi:hypothetical protein
MNRFAGLFALRVSPLMGRFEGYQQEYPSFHPLTSLSVRLNYPIEEPWVKMEYSFSPFSSSTSYSVHVKRKAQDASTRTRPVVEQD